MIRLDAATVLLQWATGGLFFLWITTRRREVGIGYGWLLRSLYGALAVGALVAGVALEPVPVREVAAALVAGAAAVALVVSIAGRRDGIGAFPPRLDLVAPVIGTVGLVAAALDAAGGRPLVSLLRTLAGAAFLGAVTDAMLLGHWYLVQPGLARTALLDLVRWTSWVWPVEVVSLLLPTGMVSVWTGAIDDGYQGIFGWTWGVCALSTIALCFVTRAALRERSYSAVMAATGLLYLAILMAFGTDLVARAVLA